ncbi:hypothetical protein H0E87_000769 [Populus deltoides]|uniref:Uncharacterized protein n=1 Tax=Populus deltoides TaxID=3696 RepID=A0A8T2ZP32_POPDE|nr:hypothetical protein H0E87_000769 [Populus deltoides]
MDNGDIEGGGGLEDEFHTNQSGRKYRPVVAHDPAVLEMSSIPPGSSSSNHQSSLKKIIPGGSTQAKTNTNTDGVNDNSTNGSEREHKLELFGFDSLVNILGLKSMTGEPVAAPSSPRDGEDGSISFDRDRPRPNDLKLGTMMGVFIPCLQNILGIIYYIRFSWIVGMAGIGESLVLVAFCGLCTFLTGISLSAIATNGAMKL